MNEKPPLLISACLLGQPVRYDAASKPLPPERLARLTRDYRLVPVCPECLGGLPTPRPAAEITGGDAAAVWQGRAKVATKAGDDVTAAFRRGAREALALARAEGCAQALLKANSPSCGGARVYDGSFSGCLRPGEGVAAHWLRRHGVEVINEDQLP
nr:DUF523 domain-containing protein [Chromobacterium sp. ASV5]